MAFVLSFMGASAAHAVVVVPVGGGWVSFFFNGTGDSLEPFQVNSPDPVTFTIADGFLSGDEFSLDGLGDTSTPASVGDDIGDDFAGALADARWSSGTYSLPAGNHLITGTVKSSPYGFGEAGARADIVNDPPSNNPIVPEPSSALLLTLGLLAGITQRRLTSRSRAHSC